jgi:hypothetical protein
MPTTAGTDTAEQARDLLALAAWYRSWAELTESNIEKGLRLDMAIGLEKRARAMLRPD